MRLLYFFLPGCTTCAAVKPIVEEFKRKHPEVPTIMWDLTLREWEDPVEPPDTAPSFAVIRRGHPPRTLTGQTMLDKLGGRPMTYQELEKWVLQ